MGDAGQAYLTHSRFEREREGIRQWLVRSLLKTGIWRGGTDTLLTDLRRVIKESANDRFPVVSIHEEMRRRGRTLLFDEEEIEDLVDMRYGHRLTFALMSLLFPFVDLRNQFHVDHIFPTSRFTDRRLKDASVPVDKTDHFKNCKDRLANLQLLQGAENIEKRAKMPAEWLSEMYPDRALRRDYEERHLIGALPDSIVEFDAFYDARRSRLKQRISQILGRQ